MKIAWKRQKCNQSVSSSVSYSLPRYVPPDKLGSLAPLLQVDRYHAASSQAVHQVDQQKSGMESRTGVTGFHLVCRRTGWIGSAGPHTTIVGSFLRGTPGVGWLLLPI